MLELVGGTQMNIMKVLESGSVRRYHQTGVSRLQTNDQHSWEVAVILQYINPDCSKDALLYALFHDCAELHTGDMPATVKRAYADLKSMLDKIEKDYIDEVLKLPKMELDSEDIIDLKAADILSGIWFTNRLSLQGDQYARKVCNTFVDYLEQLDHPEESVYNIMWAILRGDSLTVGK